MSLLVRATAFVFADPRSRELHQLIERIAPSEATVLITGETGTGKELIARHVHANSSRRDASFVAVNCGAFLETLIESELFGYERGAFTGAHQAKAGWFETARGGTLFLDEIGDLPLPMQVKLLRVLQEREVVRLGARKAIPIDVRLIAATNVDLAEAVRAGRFREDLYYRLQVISLPLRPLRERPGDIMPLTRHFLQIYARRLHLTDVSITPDAERALLDYPWPGNIRELENVIHRALLVSHDGAVTAYDLSLRGWARNEPLGEAREPQHSPAHPLDEARSPYGAHHATTATATATAATHAPPQWPAAAAAHAPPQWPAAAAHAPPQWPAAAAHAPPQWPAAAAPGPGAGYALDTATARFHAAWRALLASGENIEFEALQHELALAAFESTDRNQVRASKRLNISRNIMRTYLKKAGVL
ncbi:sigma-54 interaction domain-containing protein [Pseudoduganella sp. UC29_71]|uniref:sigma-54 interaction domain-containing protein n=1 Tax=Pseudoduganella sp. UC29_71 TaxID=3350174 RepID=UPI00366D2B9E